MSSKPVVAIVFYSTYGHIIKMANAVKAGVEASGAECRMYQVPETLPKEVLEKMHAPEKDPKIPTITDPKDLLDCDAILFGLSTRFGTFPAQMKAFMDSCGGIWSTQGFAGKIASVFFSTATVAGGQETAALSMLPWLTHQGMIFAPIGYGNPKLFNLTEVHGGSPWGAGTLAGGDGSRQASDLELDLAQYQGGMVAKYAAIMKKGKA